MSRTDPDPYPYPTIQFFQSDESGNFFLKISKGSLMALVRDLIEEYEGPGLTEEDILRSIVSRHDILVNYNHAPNRLPKTFARKDA